MGSYSVGEHSVFRRDGPQPSWSLQRDWVLSLEEACERFALALEAGVTFFDTPDVYSVGAIEEITGRWHNEMASRSCHRTTAE